MLLGLYFNVFELLCHGFEAKKALFALILKLEGPFSQILVLHSQITLPPIFVPLNPFQMGQYASKTNQKHIFRAFDGFQCY